MSRSAIKPTPPIPAVLPGPGGHQFVVYGDSCSGVPGAPHEATTAAVNRVVARLEPSPEFICFLGDEIIGLTTDESALRAQWAHWFDQEMAWLDRARTPLYHTTANHTTYDAMSERVYAGVMAHLPANGPANQRHLSYWVRWDDLLLVFVNTMWTGLGEGRVETAWLAETLAAHAAARHKLVLGHHPVFPVNGYLGPFGREFPAADKTAFWEILRAHGVLAYLCSHMLAFDVQVHAGILQIMTAGAGTAHRMPEDVEYLHAVQLALDDTGLRYQVLDDTGAIRERLTWPFKPAPATNWLSEPPMATVIQAAEGPVAFALAGVSAPVGGPAQTLVSLWNDDSWLPPVWIGLFGPEQRLGVLLAPRVGRSPHLWHGPALPPGEPFAFQVALHPDMGPGGILWRADETSPWQSLTGTAAWGPERLPPTARVSVGHDKGDSESQPFRGTELDVRWWIAG